MPNRPALPVADVLFSAKIFAAAMMAYGIAIYFDLSRPYWAVGTVYIVAHPLSGAITSKAVYRLFGTIAGGIMTVVLVPNLVNSPEILTIAIALWVGICLFVSLLDRTPRSYAFQLSGYTVLMAGLPLVDTPGNAFDTAVARVEEIGLGIICAALVSRIVFPRHAGPVLLGRVDAWLSNAATLVRDSFSGTASDAKVRERQRLASDAVDMRAFTTHVSYDASHHSELTDLMRGLQQRMVLLLPLLSTIEDHLAALRRLSTPATTEAERVFERVAAWVEHGADASPWKKAGLHRDIAAIEAANEQNFTWEGALLVNASHRLHNLVEIWSDCQSLRADIRDEKISSRSRRIIAASGQVRPHLDYGMAFVSALAAALAILLGTLFWIGSGQSDGMAVAQLAGVFCCILAAIDDPIPAMRKFVTINVWAALFAFVYIFAVLPIVDGFVPLVAALGLFLIPAGVCLAVPSLFLVGMGLCVNFIFMLVLSARLSMDLASFLNNNIATVLAGVCAMIATGLVKSIGAEASARRILRAAHREIATIMSRPKLDRDRIVHRLLDLLGLLAPRIAAVSPDSDVASADLLRDLRVGINLADLRDFRVEAPALADGPLGSLFSEVTDFYVGTTQGVARAPERLTNIIDACLAETFRAPGDGSSRKLRMLLASLRLCLFPDAADFGPVVPQREITRVAT
ncbi:MAG: FUSC family protein [Rhizobiaceae bacterium]|nr:FUSC family protein [Rhizobiaceae bacterium]